MGNPRSLGRPEATAQEVLGALRLERVTKTIEPLLSRTRPESAMRGLCPQGQALLEAVERSRGFIRNTASHRHPSSLPLSTWARIARTGDLDPSSQCLWLPVARPEQHPLLPRPPPLPAPEGGAHSHERRALLGCHQVVLGRSHRDLRGDRAARPACGGGGSTAATTRGRRRAAASSTARGSPPGSPRGNASSSSGATPDFVSSPERLT